LPKVVQHRPMSLARRNASFASAARVWAIILLLVRSFETCGGTRRKRFAGRHRRAVACHAHRSRRRVERRRNGGRRGPAGPEEPRPSATGNSRRRQNRHDRSWRRIHPSRHRDSARNGDSGGLVDGIRSALQTASTKSMRVSGSDTNPRGLSPERAENGRILRQRLPIPGRPVWSKPSQEQAAPSLQDPTRDRRRHLRLPGILSTEVPPDTAHAVLHCVNATIPRLIKLVGYWRLQCGFPKAAPIRAAAPRLDQAGRRGAPAQNMPKWRPPAE
jgi:hypothetical protein